MKRGEDGGEAAGDGEGRGGAVPPCRPLPDLLAAAGDCLPGGVFWGSYPKELSFIKGSYYQRECRSLRQCVLSSPGVIPWLCDTPPFSGLNCISTWPHYPLPPSTPHPPTPLPAPPPLIEQPLPPWASPVAPAAAPWVSCWRPAAHCSRSRSRRRAVRWPGSTTRPPRHSWCVRTCIL